MQAAFQKMEERKAVENRATYLPKKLEHRRITKVLKNGLPALVEQLRRHSKQVARMIRAGTALVERATELTLAKRTIRMTESDFWKRVANML